MATVREAIREQNRLARMRNGQDVPERVDIPSMPGIGACLVPLTEAEAQRGIVAAADLDVNDNQAGMMARERAATISDIWHALREPGDPDQRVFETPEDMTATLKPTDIDHLADTLVTLQDYASPSVDGMSEEELDDLKKAFGETDWSALTGRRWAAMKLCCSILFPELLAVKLRGFSSIDSSTPTNESGEST
jgi:hypothetical protein